MTKIGNLFQYLPAQLPEEVTQCLLSSGQLRIERIVSRGHCSKPDFWYDQDQAEWVVVLQGEARLRFDEADRCVHLRSGMYVNIAAHEKHRVEWTKPDEDTVWLAVLY